MKTRLKRILNIGGSYVVVLPRPFAEAAGMRHGDKVAVIQENNKIILWAEEKDLGDETDDLANKRLVSGRR